VRPIVEAGLHELVPSRHLITDEVFLEPTPGHTPGHVSVRIESRGQSAIITGDMVHHPMQLAEPDWGSHPDAEPERAADTRRAFVARYGDRPVLVIGTHFAGPTAGRIVRRGDSCRLVCR
jgi:glyoxylase-like metal-dependent hydrolase (beta-lactamase superfamily II)